MMKNANITRNGPTKASVFAFVGVLQCAIIVVAYEFKWQLLLVISTALGLTLMVILLPLFRKKHVEKASASIVASQPKIGPASSVEDFRAKFENTVSYQKVLTLIDSKNAHEVEKLFCNELIHEVNALIPNFTSSLRACSSKLTRQDLYVCCIHLMNFPTKQLPYLLGVTSIRTVHQRRKSILKRMNISSSETLAAVVERYAKECINKNSQT
jgi:hypothetical protein